MSREYGKTIHTGLFTEEAKKLMKVFIDSAMKRYDSEIYYQLQTIDVDRAPDGEVLLNQDDYNGYARSIWKKPNNEGLKWIAIRMKEYVRWWGGKTDGMLPKGVKDWSRYSDENVRLENKDEANEKVVADVSDFYFLYDFLLQRKKLDGKYPKAKFEKFVGTPNDPITTALEIAKREEIENLKKAHAAQCKELDIEKEHEDEVLHEEWSKKRDELQAKYEAKRKELVKKQAQEMIDLKKTLEMA